MLITQLLLLENMGCKHSKQETATTDYGGAPNDVDNDDDYSSFKRVKQLLRVMDKLDPSVREQDAAIKRLASFVGAEMGITDMALPASVVMALAREGCRGGSEFKVELVGDGNPFNYVVVPVGERGDSTDV